jgi:hypothetical protein
MMGHRHITTTERYLHYAPDPDAAAKLSGLWQSDDPSGEPLGSLVPFRSVPHPQRSAKVARLQHFHREATTGIEPV